MLRDIFYKPETDAKGDTSYKKRTRKEIAEKIDEIILPDEDELEYYDYEVDGT